MNNEHDSSYAMIRKDLSSLAVTKAGVAVDTVGAFFSLAELMQRGGFLPKGVNVEGATIAMIHGSTLGLNPFASVQGIAVINGRPSIWGDTLVGVVMASGLLEDIKTEQMVDADRRLKGYRVSVKRKGIASVFTATFTIDKANKAGLLTKVGPWTTNPDRMLMVRARAFVLRDAFADVLQGLGIREEEEDAARTVYVETDEAKVSPPPYASEAAAPAEAPEEKKEEPKSRGKLLAATRKRAAQISAVPVDAADVTVSEARKADPEPVEAVPVAPAAKPSEDKARVAGAPSSASKDAETLPF